MKKLKKILRIVAIVLVILIIAAFFIIKYISGKAIPDYSESVKLKAITEEVTIYRDSFAIPHIYAKNENDLYFATGWVMAQDRLWQMDLLRHVTQGRLTEIFGETYVDTDLLLRALRFSEKSKMVIDSLPANVLECAKAFTKGVNTYIEKLNGSLPVEFTLLGYKPEKWEITHSINLIGYMAWDLKSGWNEDIALFQLLQKLDKKYIEELIPDLSLYNFQVFPKTAKIKDFKSLNTNLLTNVSKLEEIGAQVFNASNNWAVSGKKSITGKPILANDMHLGFGSPGIWYQIHQVVEGKLNVTGVALPGQPFVICGHNERIAWGMTNTYTDNLDFYLESLNPSNPNQYKFNGAWKDLVIKNEVFKYSKNKSVSKTLKFTHRGAIISDLRNIKGSVISMHWTGNEYSNELLGVYFLNRANNWKEFRNGCQYFKSVSQNIAYADVDGNIGLQCSAGAPLRKGNGITVYSGETDEFDWKGMLPFDSLPNEYNPTRGYVSSANNLTIDTSYKHYIGTWFGMPWRINRIREMLEAKEKLSVDDFKTIQTDFTSKYAFAFKDFLIKNLKNISTLSETEKKCFEMFKDWNGNIDAKSPIPLIMNQLRQKMFENIFSDEVPADLLPQVLIFSNYIEYKILKGKDLTWIDDIRTKDQREAIGDILLISFQQTIKMLTEKFGDNPNEWQWGDAHQLTIEHPMAKVKILNFIFSLNKGAFPMNGDATTVNPYAYKYDGSFKIAHGASHRHIYNLADWDLSQTVIPTGESGIPASKHYCDQTKLFISNQYHNDFFTDSKIKNNSLYKMSFN